MKQFVRVLAMVVAVAAGGAVAMAQQPKKVARIGYLAPGDAAGDSVRAEAIRQALHERGYIEGQNIAFDYRYGEGKREHYPKLAAKLVHLKVDIIVVAGSSGAFSEPSTKFLCTACISNYSRIIIRL